MTGCSADISDRYHAGIVLVAYYSTAIITYDAGGLIGDKVAIGDDDIQPTTSNIVYIV